MKKHHEDQMITKAIEVAAKTHRSQQRKSTNIPYIVHPFEIAMILQRNGIDDEEILAAGILHDTLEDGGLKPSYLAAHFSERVKELVLQASEEIEGREDRPWKDRKLHTIETIRGLDPEGKLVVCADKLSNGRSMIRNYHELGEDLWKRFNAGYEDQRWYYRELVSALEDLKEYPMYRELSEIVEELFSEEKSLKD